MGVLPCVGVLLKHLAVDRTNPFCRDGGFVIQGSRKRHSHRHRDRQGMRYVFIAVSLYALVRAVFDCFGLMLPTVWKILERSDSGV